MDTPTLVHALRVRAAISQEELARRLDVSYASVNAWERGRTEPRSRHRAQLDELAAALGVRQALRVLVVDGSPTVAARTRRLVEDAATDAVVRTASTATTALLTCGSFRPDLVLLDLSVPHLDALEVADAMSEVDELAATVLVFVAGPVDARLRRAAERVARVATKPLVPVDVAALVALVDAPDAVRAADLDVPSPRTAHAGGARP